MGAVLDQKPDGRQVKKTLGPAWTYRGRPPAGYFTKRTAEAWLRRMDRHKSYILPLFKKTYGDNDAGVWWVRWRLFYLACAILIVGMVLLLRRGGDDPFYRLIRGTLPGVVLYIGLAVSYTSLRLEMAFLPALAVGLALLFETLRSHRAATTPEHRDRPGPPVRDELLVPTS